MKYDSDEEKYFHAWLLELQEAGYVDSISRADSIKLCDPVVCNGITELASVIYTPDFQFKVLKEGKYFQPHDNITVSPRSRSEQRVIYNSKTKQCLVEVKPIKDVRGKTSEAKLKIKWARTLGYVIDLVKIPGSSNKGGHLFKKSFTPKVYLKTPTGRERKMNYEYETIKE